MKIRTLFKVLLGLPFAILGMFAGFVWRSFMLGFEAGKEEVE